MGGGVYKNICGNCAYLFIYLCNLSLTFVVLHLGKNRQSGDRNNSSEKDQKNEGIVNNNERNAGESGRGRGSREDRWNDRKPGGRGLKFVCACKMIFMAVW